MRCVACFLVMLLTACGQSGDLYLRSDPPSAPVAAEPAAAAPAPAEVPQETHEESEDAP